MKLVSAYRILKSKQSDWLKNTEIFNTKKKEKILSVFLKKILLNWSD